MELIDLITAVITPDFCKGFIAGAFFAGPVGVLAAALCSIAKENDDWALRQ